MSQLNSSKQITQMSYFQFQSCSPKQPKNEPNRCTVLSFKRVQKQSKNEQNRFSFFLSCNFNWTIQYSCTRIYGYSKKKTKTLCVFSVMHFFSTHMLDKPVSGLGPCTTLIHNSFHHIRGDPTHAIWMFLACPSQFS